MPPRQPKPPWLKHRLPPAGRVRGLEELHRGLGLHTVCREAHCPNRGECFAAGTSTFLLLGPTCTRACRFCAVRQGAPSPPDPAEPARVARAVAAMGLTYCVLTMVTRDDLPDHGAGQVARTLAAVREACPATGLEVLISDLGGRADCLATVLAARPAVLNHNLETVPRLYARARPGADYGRSLELLARAAQAPGGGIKSGLMLGLGERPDEVRQVLGDLLAAGCGLLTLGQYLAPSPEHLPVARHLPPAEFAAWREEALALGFRAVASGPLVRSSYQAHALWQAAATAGKKLV
ncbi:MAG: lipoyl synthase [Deltaproteobacteria bacterium]|nr:lipoyl synthase [Deltaproteobacteria bacterium]